MDPDKWSFFTRPARDVGALPETVIECRHPELGDFVVHLPAAAPRYFDTPEKRQAIVLALGEYIRRTTGRPSA